MFSVLLIQIDFVCLNFPGVVTEAFLVCLNLKQKVGTFVVGFPTQMVDAGKTIYHTHTYLCAIFCSTAGFASNDATYMGLEDADDTFDTGADVVVEHILLLLISLSDSRQPKTVVLNFPMKFVRR